MIKHFCHLSNIKHTIIIKLLNIYLYDCFFIIFLYIYCFTKKKNYFLFFVLFSDITINVVLYIKLENDFSFPSGHATMIFSLIVLLIYTFEIKKFFWQICFVFFRHARCYLSSVFDSTFFC